MASVDRLTPQDPRLRSVVCERGTFNPLPISPNYHYFVSAPSGIIQHYFGAHSYRVELSLPISTGTSWQLGLLVAHWAHHYNHLALTTDAHDVHHLFLTGQVTTDLDVLPVAEMDSKIRHALDWIESQQIDLKSCTLIVPKDSLITAGLPTDLVCHRVAHIDAIAAIVGLPPLRTSQPVFRRRMAISALKSRYWIPLGLVLLCAVWLWASVTPTWRDLSALESNGEYRQLLTELRRLKDSRNLLRVNTAAIFEEILRRQAEHIEQTHPLALVTGNPTPNCPQNRYALQTARAIPSHIYRDCHPQLQIDNTDASASVLWLYSAHRQETQLHLLNVGQSVKLDIANASQPATVMIVTAKRPISDILSWLDALQTQSSPDNEAVDRFLRAGISIRFIELPGTGG